MDKLITTGIEEVKEALKNLPKGMDHRVVGAAFVVASKPMVTSAKTFLHSKTTPKTGHLYHSIGAVKMPISKASVVGETLVGPQRKKFKGQHGHLIELGHRMVVGGKLGSGGRLAKKRKFVAARPFMQPAFDATKGIVISNFNDIIGKKLVASMKYWLKKNGTPYK